MYLDSLEVNDKIIWSIHSNYMQGLLLDMSIIVLYLILVSIPCCSIDTLCTGLCYGKNWREPKVIWSRSLKSRVARIWFLWRNTVVRFSSCPVEKVTHQWLPGTNRTALHYMSGKSRCIYHHCSDSCWYMYSTFSCSHFHFTSWLWCKFV